MSTLDKSHVDLEAGTAEIVEKKRTSSVSECSVEVDLEAEGQDTTKPHLPKVIKRDCRICQLSFDSSNPESEVLIELGCSCKDDLAAAHKQCADAWFKIKGNKTCEICGSIAQNVAGVNEAELVEQWNEANDSSICSSHRTSDSRDQKLLAGSSIPKLLACLHGFCICDFLALSLQCTIIILGETIVASISARAPCMFPRAKMAL